MPAPKQESQTEQKHEHRWSRTSQVESRCIGFYKGNPCVCIKIGLEELQRREEEYNNYMEYVRTTNAYRDWQEMQIASNIKDIEMMMKIKGRILKRAKVISTDSYGELLFQFDESEYLPKPDFPDPQTPFLYVIGEL